MENQSNFKFRFTHYKIETGALVGVLEQRESAVEFAYQDPQSGGMILRKNLDDFKKYFAQI